MPLYNPSQDLTRIQQLLGNDPSILSLMDLTGKPPTEIIKQIIKRSQWDNLAGSEKRLCIYFTPARKMRNESFISEVIEIDCHVPASQDHMAWNIQERIFKLLHRKKINNRYIYAEPPLGELPTMNGFFCCGTRFTFNRLFEI